MSSVFDSIFSDLGIPESCPNCGCPAWEVVGDTVDGITSVTCEQCKRHYCRGRLKDQLTAHISLLLDSMYVVETPGRIERAYDRLVSSYYMWRGDRDAFCVYLVYPGRGSADDHSDEIPF